MNVDLDFDDLPLRPEDIEERSLDEEDFLDLLDLLLDEVSLLADRDIDLSEPLLLIVAKDEPFTLDLLSEEDNDSLLDKDPRPESIEDAIKK